MRNKSVLSVIMSAKIWRMCINYDDILMILRVFFVAKC